MLVEHGQVHAKKCHFALQCDDSICCNTSTMDSPRVENPGGENVVQPQERHTRTMQYS